MREIMFRGKDVVTGEWKYGDLVSDGECRYIKPINNIFEPCGTSCEGMDNLCIFAWQVDPKTIGQFTGRKDKNGVEIYHGDIVSHKVRVWEKDRKSKTVNSVVFWDNMKAGFYVCRTHMWGERYISGDIGNIRSDHLNSTDKIKIGNITDNPELLR